VSSRPFRRVLVKLSGGLVADPRQLAAICHQLRLVHRRGTGVVVVLGGGNIIRGRDAAGPGRVRADQAGMLATVINGIELTGRLEPHVPVSHLSAFAVSNFVEQYSVNRALDCLSRGRMLVLSGGTGNPFFSTDSAAALRAAELGLEVILKGTRVRGVYSADPEKNPRARFHPRLTYEQALAGRLQVMDLTAFAICMEHRIPIVVFDITRPRAIIDSVAGKRIGSIIC
jgi:uridylate kinase